MTPRPLWLLPSFLCLDAPFAALGWTLCLARDGRVAGARGPESAALFAAVWLVYLGDRIFDARRHRSLPPKGLAPRHEWARRHPLMLASLAGVAALVGAAALPWLETRTLLAGGALALATGIYFGVFRLSRLHRRMPRRLPTKELGIAFVFTAGVALAAGVGRPFPAATLASLGLLVLGNCLLIARVERGWDRLGDEAAYFAGIGGPNGLPEAGIAASCALGAFAVFRDGGAAPVALALCAAATLGVARWRGEAARVRAQALADGLHWLAWGAWIAQSGAFF